MSGPATTLPRLAAAVAVLAIGARDAGAQYNTAPAPAAYALEGVTVVTPDGRRTAGVTIVVRDGLIESMGAGVAVPAGARLLSGDSLVVYPGLVDAQGAARFAFPTVEMDRATVSSWDAPRTLQGFTPHRRVVDVLQATGKDLAAQRKAGVVAAAVHPEAALIAGRSTVLMLRPSASTPAELVEDPDAGVLFGLRGARGVYPGTMFATTTFIRQALEDTRHAGLVQASYARDSKGMVRPPNDPDYAVLQRVLSGDERVFFTANTPEEIGYAVHLGEQYGFTPVIVGGRDAWRMTDLLKSRDVTVLASVDFARPERWKPDAKADSGATRPMEAAVLREKEELEEAYANAGKLARAGVRFALTSGGGKADLREGARKAIEYGLGEADALRAVTATPAELLGLSRLMALAPGAPATFVVVDGPLFGKDTKVVYTLVDGELEKGGGGAATPRAGATAAGAAGSAAVAGKWSLDIESSQGSISGAMTLSGTPESFTGSIDTEMGALPVKDGKVAGGDVAFTVVFPFMQNAEIPFTGTLTNGELSATASTPMGEVKVSGKRSGPGATEND
ncbi:MAG: amidohydrolase family protein [Gemmatimonadaceae bacterium]